MGLCQMIQEIVRLGDISVAGFFIIIAYDTVYTICIPSFIFWEKNTQLFIFAIRLERCRSGFQPKADPPPAETGRGN
jgi:hypothetical protein